MPRTHPPAADYTYDEDSMPSAVPTSANDNDHDGEDGMLSAVPTSANASDHDDPNDLLTSAHPDDHHDPADDNAPDSRKDETDQRQAVSDQEMRPAQSVRQRQPPAYLKDYVK